MSIVVDHFNTFVTGGAAIAARRIHDAVAAAGVSSRFWHAPHPRTKADDPSCQPIQWSQRSRSIWGAVADRYTALVRKVSQKRDLARHLANHPAELEFFALPVRPWPTRFEPLARGSDLVHLHWVAKLLDYPSFFESIPDDFPIVWTLHDMNALTGGCHYTVGCESFTSQCGCCPLLGRRGPRDVANRSFHVKRAALAGKNLHIVACSDWLQREARRSRLLEGARSFRTIHYGLDLRAYSPRDRELSRSRFDLPADAVIVAFGAESFDNLRKGVRPLLEALAQLRRAPRVVGVFFGRGEIPRLELELPELRSLGYLSELEDQAMLYSAADLFVIPSLQDALPQTGLEAMACGTPVVGFNVGGIPDFVRHGETGLLAEPEAHDLARQLQYLVDRPDERRRMGAAARSLMLREFRRETQAAVYVDLYESLVEEYAKKGAAAPGGRKTHAISLSIPPPVVGAAPVVVRAQ